jgi:hypothetical protein
MVEHGGDQIGCHVTMLPGLEDHRGLRRTWPLLPRLSAGLGTTGAHTTI